MCSVGTLEELLMMPKYHVTLCMCSSGVTYNQNAFKIKVSTIYFQVLKKSALTAYYALAILDLKLLLSPLSLMGP